MIVQVWKSLDKPSSIFGLRGSYGKYVLIACLVLVVVAIIIGTLTAGLWGFLFLVVSGGSTYGIAMIVQSKYSDKLLSRLIEASNLPDGIRVPPKMMRNYCIKPKQDKKETD